MLSELASPVLTGWSISLGSCLASVLLLARPLPSPLPLLSTGRSSVCPGSSWMSRIRLRLRSWMFSAVAWTSQLLCLHGITSPVLLQPPLVLCRTSYPPSLFLCAATGMFRLLLLSTRVPTGSSRGMTVCSASSWVPRLTRSPSRG